MSDDMQHHRLQAIAESSALLVGSRLVTPVLLLICIGLIGFFGAGFITEQKDQGKDLAQVKSDFRVFVTRMDSQFIRQVEGNTDRVEKLEDRVEVIERTLPTP